MLIEDRLTIVAEILGEDLSADAAVGQELYEALLPYTERRPGRPQEIIFDMDEPTPVWRSKKREMLRRAFALKRGIAYERIKDLPFRELVKLIPRSSNTP
jgi:hypothetical protein